MMVSPQDLIIVSLIVEMMVLGFSLLYLLFSRDAIAPRILFILIGVIAYVSVISVAISYMFFWSGNLLLGILMLVAAALIFCIPAGAGRDPVQWKENYAYTLPVISALIVYEISMGFLYGSAFLPHTSNAFLLAINNIDFSAMMAADAIFFLLVTKRGKSLPDFALFTFAISMALMPNFYIEFGKTAELVSIILSASVMVINILMLYVIQLKHKAFRVQMLTVGLAGSDLIMMSGLAYYALSGDITVMSISMVISMAIYFVLVTQKLSMRSIKPGRTFAFLLLVLVNAAELTMSLGDTSLGMVLSNSLFPASTGGYASLFASLNPGMAGSINFSNPLWWLFPFDPGKIGLMAFHKGLSVNLPFAYFWSSFMFIMTTTMSPFYVIMMGSEMSYLVLERYRNSRDSGVRRWTLAIIAGIPLFVVLIPFYSPAYVFGMSGMIFSIPLAIFLVSVASIAVASILFGRRVQCNLVCMAAHMWTNSYYDQFKPGKHRPGLWSIIRWASFSLMLVFFGAFTLQEVGIVGPIRIGTVEINPLDFYGMFVLNYIWWFLYFLTPVFGTYSCARQGWCGFGTLSGIFNKFFFRVKAADVSVCESCQTKECQNSCPVAIPLGEDMLRKGYSNRISCVGCGDCVESCTYGNLAIRDIRDRVGRRRDTGNESAR